MSAFDPSWNVLRFWDTTILALNTFNFLMRKLTITSCARICLSEKALQSWTWFLSFLSSPDMGHTSVTFSTLSWGRVQLNKYSTASLFNEWKELRTCPMRGALSLGGSYNLIFLTKSLNIAPSFEIELATDYFIKS